MVARLDLTRHNSANVTRTDCTSNDIRHMYTLVGFCMTTDESLHYYLTATTTMGAISYSVGLNDSYQKCAPTRLQNVSATSASADRELAITYRDFGNLLFYRVSLGSV